MRESIPKFLNGVYSFEGAGYEKPLLLSDKLSYCVPPDRRSQLTYFRAGNSSDDMIYVIIMKDGAPMRYFPVGAASGIHVSLAVTEDLEPSTKLDVFVGAPADIAGSIVLDVGFVEI
ncbi:molybdopterin oxidoreductase [Methylocella silvestris]|uniref:Molybdopterin oxidoreductase n=1 Tax=Methylocella silvestris TaxID=199596 RepID=A0A2J7TM08_METSI|nr:molybdopterin oxidoreductase [Methylocella silvestris]PNG27802.1 molybdopterin oxidoreductase [Methylocella silvestris]